MGKELILTSCLAPDPEALSMALTASDEDIAPEEVAVLARPRPTARSDTWREGEATFKSSFGARKSFPEIFHFYS